MQLQIEKNLVIAKAETPEESTALLTLAHNGVHNGVGEKAVQKTVQKRRKMAPYVHYKDDPVLNGLKTMNVNDVRFVKAEEWTRHSRIGSVLVCFGKKNDMHFKCKKAVGGWFVTRDK